MKSIKELSRETGHPYATLQFWKRSGLLPPPVSKNGRTELFDDSTIARIQTILDLQSQGMSLENVASALHSQGRAVGNSIESKAVGRTTHGEKEFSQAWFMGDCKKEVCNLLSIDPAFASEPSCCGPLPDGTPAPADVFLAISTKEKVYLASVRVVLHEHPRLIEAIQISRKIYGHLLLCVVEQSDLSLASPAEVAFAALDEKRGRVLLKKAELSGDILDLGLKAAQVLRSIDDK